jgi:hypothetical protein
MTIDIKKITSAAKLENEAILSEEAAQRKKKRDEREAAVSSAVALLEKWIIPRLEKAAQELAGENIKTKIDRQFDMMNRSTSVWPSVSFRCSTPPRRSDRYTSDTPPIFFKANHGRIYVGYAKNGYDTDTTSQFGDAVPEDVEELVQKAFEYVVSQYYQTLRNLPYNVNS